jgi:predicted transcriptional regulator
MRRNDLDICADLLKVAKNGAKKTQLVYKANLNFNIIKKYLERLTDNGLIESEKGRFFTTDKGAKYLEQYREFIEPFGFNRGIAS